MHKFRVVLASGTIMLEVSWTTAINKVTVSSRCIFIHTQCKINYS
jgi:hypothetical protein